MKKKEPTHPLPPIVRKEALEVIKYLDSLGDFSDKGYLKLVMDSLKKKKKRK